MQLPPSDAELLAAHVAGQPRAFDELLRRHQDRLWAVAMGTLRDPDEAADALQDALISALRGAGSFRGDSAVTTWLHRIVVNACLDRIRRRRVRRTVPLPDEGAAEPAEPRDRLAERDAVLVVREALQWLGADQRAAITLVDLYGYSVVEAAQILGVADGTVKSRCARGRLALASRLGHLREEFGGRPAVGVAADRRPGGRAEPGTEPGNGPARPDVQAEPGSAPAEEGDQ